MSSKLEIINAAFLLLGHKPVTNLIQDTGNDVKRAIALYDVYYTACLCHAYWRFSIKQAELNNLASYESVEGYEYAYQIPNDSLAIYMIEPNNVYRIFGTTIYSNISSGLKLYYTAYVPESNLPDYYVEYLVERFAGLFAMPITNNSQLAKLWAQSADIKLDRAMTLDGFSQSSERIQSNPLATAKFSYGNTSNGYGSF